MPADDTKDEDVGKTSSPNDGANQAQSRREVAIRLGTQAQVLEMADAYKQRKEELRDKQRQEVHRRLARLKAKQDDREAEFPPDGFVDAEHRELLLKYGDRLSKPAARQWRPSPRSDFHDEDSSKPTRGRQSSRQHSGSNSKASSALPALAPAAENRAAPTGGPGSPSNAPPRQLPRASAASGNFVSDASHAEAGASGAATAGGGQQQPLQPQQQPHSPKDGVSQSTDSYDSPSRSLMPRKDMLRKKQKMLLKSSNCVHFRQHLTDQFKKIVDNVEMEVEGLRQAAKTGKQVLVPPFVPPAG